MTLWPGHGTQIRPFAARIYKFATCSSLICAAFVCAVFLPSFVAAADQSDDELTLHSGYLSDVSGERSTPSHEFVIMPLSEPESDGKLIDKIFTDKLKHDFVKQYRDTFGYTEYEQINYTSNRFVDVQGEDSNRLTPVNEYIDKQNTFGKYMLKKLAEYHVDNYLKNSHDLKVVYETKQKFSNIEYKTDNGSKLKVKYDLASNITTLSLEKPEEKFHKSIDIKMSASSPNTVAHASYDLTKVLRLETNYGIEQELGTLTLTKKLQPNLAVSVSLQTYQKALDDLTPAQNRILFGLSWND